MGQAQLAEKDAVMQGVKTTGSSHMTPSLAKPIVMYDLSLDQLHDRLVLTPQQQDFWIAYENKVTAYTTAYYRQRPVLPSSDVVAPLQVSRLVDNLQNRLAALEDVESSAKILYANLMPEQQIIANQMLLLTIPTFSPSNLPAEDTHRKDSKAEVNKRSRRGGAGTGMGGPMLGN